MKDYNKNNLKRLMAMFVAVLITFFAIVTVTISFRLMWWATLPTSGVAIATAVFIFKRGFVDKEKEE